MSSVRTPIWLRGEEITPDQYDVIFDTGQRPRYGTRRLAKAKPGTLFYHRMAAWPLALEAARGPLGLSHDAQHILARQFPEVFVGPTPARQLREEGGVGRNVLEPLHHRRNAVEVTTDPDVVGSRHPPDMLDVISDVREGRGPPVNDKAGNERHHDDSTVVGEALQVIAEALKIRIGVDPVDYGISNSPCVVSALLPRSGQGIVGSLYAVKRQVLCRLVKIRSGMPDLAGGDDPTESNVGLLNDVLDLIRSHDLCNHGPYALPH